METFEGFPKQTLSFLSGIARNNEKAWFDAHHEDYEQYFMAPARRFVMALGDRLRALSKTVHAEPKVNGSIMRINRDIRFSKDKSPYKDHLDLWFWDGPEKSWACSGFFFRLKPGSLMLGAGMHHFEKEMLDAYRRSVVDPKKGARLVTAVNAVRKLGYEVGGAEYKKPPRGFTAEGERAPLLLHGGLYVGVDVAAPKELSSPAFVEFCFRHYQKMLPLHVWLRDELAR